MGLRVLDDDRPGFALLAFAGSLDRASLSISIRSLRENTFLGPDGKWQKAPHFFAAERAGDDGRQTLYRVGPEIVNYLLEHDRVEVASADGALREETLWGKCDPADVRPIAAFDLPCVEPRHQPEPDQPAGQARSAG